ncbi:unnamed protein product [Spodoptera exigua]|nr:unnamed protein product [Spodoptera exigua]
MMCQHIANNRLRKTDWIFCLYEYRIQNPEHQFRDDIESFREEIEPVTPCTAASCLRFIVFVLTVKIVILFRD